MNWIKISDEFPTPYVEVLCFSKGIIYHAWHQDFNDWYEVKDEYGIEGVTHWMPLMELPEEWA